MQRGKGTLDTGEATEACTERTTITKRTAMRGRGAKGKEAGRQAAVSGRVAKRSGCWTCTPQMCSECVQSQKIGPIGQMQSS